MSDDDVFVEGDPLVAMAVALDGTVLPVSVGSIEFAKSSEWPKYVRGLTFNAIFYSALKAAGVGQDEANLDIRILSDYRLPFGMTKIQVRVAYGVEKGVIGRHYRFNPSKLDGTDWEVRLMESKAKEGNRVGRGAHVFDNLEWDRLETDALAACAGLPDQVDIAVEFRWIRCNLHQAPYFKGAPSQGAVKDWLTCMKPGNEALLRDFTNLAWSRRLSPGDRKMKKSAFAEDTVGESVADAAVDIEALKARLGMTEG